MSGRGWRRWAGGIFWGVTSLYNDKQTLLQPVANAVLALLQPDVLTLTACYCWSCCGGDGGDRTTATTSLIKLMAVPYQQLVLNVLLHQQLCLDYCHLLLLLCPQQHVQDSW